MALSYIGATPRRDEALARPAPRPCLFVHVVVRLCGAPCAGPRRTLSPIRIRTFVALDVDADLSATAGAISEHLRAGVLARARASWVPPERMHVTVRFLGDVEASRVPELARALDLVPRDAVPLISRRLHGFPDPRRARVLVLPFDEDEDLAPAARLARALDDALVGLGFEPETRPYVPHLTLARLREVFDLRAVVRDGVVDLRGRATGLTLYRSELSSSGPTYTALARVVLR